MTYLKDVGLEDEGVVDGDLLDLGHLFEHNASAQQGGGGGNFTHKTCRTNAKKEQTKSNRINPNQTEQNRRPWSNATVAVVPSGGGALLLRGTFFAHPDQNFLPGMRH